MAGEADAADRTRLWSNPFHANVLNSTRAAQVSVFVVRAFVRMRGILTDTQDLTRNLSAVLG